MSGTNNHFPGQATITKVHQGVHLKATLSDVQEIRAKDQDGVFHFQWDSS